MVGGVDGAGEAEEMGAVFFAGDLAFGFALAFGLAGARLAGARFGSGFRVATFALFFVTFLAAGLEVLEAFEVGFRFGLGLREGMRTSFKLTRHTAGKHRESLRHKIRPGLDGERSPG